MADEKLVRMLREGVEKWNEWRKNTSMDDIDLTSAFLNATTLSGADLTGVDLTGAHLYAADLTNADLAGANFTGANFSSYTTGFKDGRLVNLSKDFWCTFTGAKLSNAKFIGVDLTGVNFTGFDLIGTKFTGAILTRATLTGAILTGANFSNADLRQAVLIDSNLDGADLTGAKLWETQRSGWSIKGITCQRAFWDRDGKEPTEYGNGDFERIFAEKPHIVLRYPGGMSPVDLAMLPLIVERLQTEHPNCALHIRSVQDNGSGAAVTITVEDLAGRNYEDFTQDVEVLRGDLATLQQRVQQEERLRLQAEASYGAMVRDVLPMLLEKALPKTEVHVGQITGPTIIESTTTMSRDTYNVHGQTGAVGSNAHAHDMTFQQVQNQGAIDLPRLAEELARLRTAMKQEAEGKPEQDEAIGEVAKAEKVAGQGDDQTALRHLKTAGTWTLGVAEKIGVPLVVEVMKRMM